MYEKKILDAIQILVDNSINKAGFDKTVQAIISKCVDEKNGKYVVIYQDSSFYAYSNDTSQIYNAGTPVYVLIPNNDFTKTKTIIGSVNKLGSDYINTIDTVNKYESVGNSIVKMNNEQGVCSYVNGDVLVLYNKTDTESEVDVDTVAASTYLKQSKYLILGGNFRTNLNKEQKYKGMYGLAFDLNFSDNVTGETVKRTYMMNVNNMLGNPYEYSKASEQKIVFDIDGVNFIDIDKIYLFCYDFPVESAESKPDDIFVSDIFLKGANELSQDELAGNKLTLITPQGIIFNNNDNSNKRIDTEVKIDNKIINKDSSLLKYFWFKENYAIDASNILYNRYGGNGWECLNEKNIIEKDNNNNPTLVDWITNQSSYIIKKENLLSRTTDYKCVVVYNNEIILTKKITVYNYSSNYIVTIDSDSGVYFSYDNGSPTLTCNVNVDGNYTYKWGMFDNSNTFSKIEETTQRNTNYHTTLNNYNNLQTGLANGTILLTAERQQELAQLKYELEQLNSMMRVEGNTIYNLQLNMITNFANFICAVYDSNNNYIGKGQIKIENDLNRSENKYTLVINHGDQVFKYNNEGISPTSKSLEKPQEIYPLSFTLFDEKGIEIDNSLINAKNVFWTVPINDTMIKVSAVHGNPISKDEFNETETYTEYKEFFFNIPTLYSGNKNRNTIQLKIKYKDKIVIAETELLFLKEGESGSNGTDFVCRIVPNTTDGEITPLYPIVTYDNNAIEGTTNPTINFIPRNENVWFKAQLYHNGSEIFNGTSSGVTTEDKNVTIKWEIMKNRYATINNVVYEDVSNFNVNENTGVFSYNNLDSVTDETLKSNPANIVKCTLTYDGIDYIATMPIILVKVNNGNGKQYKISLNDNTGFRYAMYTTDGRKPIYDNSNPFALKVIQTVEGVDQDISINTMPEYSIEYDWSENAKGIIYADEWKEQSNLIIDTLRDRNLQKNEKYYKPVDEFNGLCLSNALYCEIKRDNNTLASIHIPIHLYLNRYGNAAMNSWDGNSISIDENGGTILAPQIGAGKKESDNSFTGVFMGTVAEAGSEGTETGLFGYNKGSRTIELNSENGSAKFGKAGAGQIIISPDETDAHSVLKSGSYEPPVLDEHGNIITPGEGLEIDLTDPHITFGSGNFRVDKDGNVFARGFATVQQLESGEINIPGVENFKAEYATDRVEFTTDSTLTPVDTSLTKSITGKCLYKDNYISGYTIEMIDDNGTKIIDQNSNPITINGIKISIGITGQTFSINFEAAAARQWSSAVNSYTFKFSYTPIGSTTQTLTKIFSANAVMMGEDGRSITSAVVEYKASTSATTPPTGTWSSSPVNPASGEYLWTRTTINYNSGNPTITYSVSYKAQDGLNGASSYTHIKYSINSTGNPMVDTPTSETKYIGICINNSSTAPSTYTSYTWSKYIGENGSDGNGIKDTDISYKQGDNGVDIPSDTPAWSPTPIQVDQGKYLWTRTIITYDDDTTSTSYSVARMGVNGQPGAQGPKGDPGKDGTSVTVKGSYNTLNELIAAHPSGNILGDGYVIGLDLYIYTNEAGGSGSLSGDWKNVGQFKGEDAYTVILSNESHTFPATNSAATASSTTIEVSAYKGGEVAVPSIGTITGQVTGLTTSVSGNIITVSADTTLTTQNGELSIPITVDGKQFTKIFSWSLAKAGSNGTSPTAYSLIVSHAAVVKNANGTYNPSVIKLTAKSQTGNASIKNFTTGRYAIFLNGSSTATATPASAANYSYTIPANTTSIRIALYNSSTGTTILDEQTVSIVSDGNGIIATEVKYLNDSQGTTPPGDSADWSSSIPAEDSNKRYLWTRTRMTYSDGNVESSYSVSYKGINGTSVTISSQEIKYGYNNNGQDYSNIPASRTTQNPGGWDTSVPNAPDGSYLWTRTKVNYSDGNSTTSYSVSYQSQDGASGVGISSITNYYLAINQSSGVTRDTAGWTTSVQAISETKPYLWNYEDILYTNNSHAYTTPAVIGRYGKDGTNGANGRGIASITEYYAINNSTTAPADSAFSTSVKAPTAANKYLWNYEKITYENPSSTVNTAKHIIGTYGRDGVDGNSIIWKGDLSSHPSNPQNLWAYYNTTDKKSYIYNGTEWETMAIDGTPGAKGQDATQYYYHVVYCNNTSTGDGYSVTPNNQIYTGTYVDTSSADATTWSAVSTKNVKWNYTKGTDATNIVCGNEAETIVCNPDGKAKAETTITIPFAGYIGSDRAACTVAYSTLPSGMTLVSNTAATAGSSGKDGSLVLKVAAAATLGNADTGIITLTFTCNSKTFVKKFTWAKAIAGEIGTGVWTTTVAPVTPNYTFTISDLVGMNRAPLIGDVIIYSYYRYTITAVDETTVLAGTRTSIRGATGAAAYSAYLTNEAQVWIHNAVQTTSTILYGFAGTTEKTVLINSVNEVTPSTKEEGIDTGLTGIKFKVSSTSAANHPVITFITDSTLPEGVSGTIPISFRITGDSVDRTAIFSYSTTTPGSNAKTVNISASSQMFTSTTGPNGTFTPQYIYLYPEFKECSYSKWQYSTNGTTWTNVTSGSNSLTIGTYNSVPNSLRIERNSNLYTSSITAISFKCISNDSSAYDTVTVIKLYDGVGISSVTNYYLATNQSSGITRDTAGWTSTIQNMTEEKQYLWNYEDILYTNNSHTYTNPSIIGRYGKDGTNGKGIVSITEYYAINNSTTAPADDDFSTNVVSPTSANKYLWNYEKIVYENPSSTVNTSKRIIGTYSSNGTSPFVSYLTNETQSFVYGTAQTTTTYLYGYQGTTEKTIQIKTINGVTAATTDTATGKTGVKFKVSSTSAVNHPLITFTTDTSLPQSTSVSIPIKYRITGESTDRTINFTYSTTTKGATGTGISSITEQYYVSTSKTSQTGGSWIETSPTWESGKYIWTRSKIVYENPSSTVYTTPVCSSEWEAVNEIKIGGRNLILDTSKDEWSFNAKSSDYYKISNYAKDYVKSNDVLTLSFEAKADVDNMYFDFYFRSSSTSYTSGFYPGYKATTEYQKFTYTHITNIDLTEIISLRIRQNTSMHGSSTTVGTLYIKNLKLELGNKDTTWTPAPEDVDTVIAKTVKTVDVEYYLSTSNTSATGGTWSTTAPAWVDGKYMWSRQKVTYVDNTTATRNETCIAGAKGSTGAVGTGIDSIIEQYYLSTSKESPTGGSWSATPQTWESGKYIWTRSQIKYKNPTSTEYTTPVCSSEWEAVNEIKIGGANLLENSSANLGNKNNWSSNTASMTLYTNGGYMNYPYFNWTKDLTSATSRSFLNNNSIKEKIQTGDKIILSGYYRNKTENATTIQIWIRFSSSGGERYVSLQMDLNTTGDWTYFEQKGTIGALSGEDNYPILQLAFNVGQSHNVDFCALKIEKGNTSTTWTPAPEDMDAAISKTVKIVDVEYYLSTSDISTEGGEWNTVAPAWVDGKYMWSRQKVTYVDGTSETRNATCIAGAKGSTGNTGATGTGVDSIIEQYYLSTSKTSQSGGSWEDTPPTWSTGKYIWTRSKITYKNPTSIVYTTPICSSEWEAVNELQIGGTNILRKTKDFSNTNVASTENGYLMKYSSSVIGEYNNFVTRGLADTTNKSSILAQYLVLNCQPNEVYTVSFFARGNGKARVYFYGPTNFLEVKSAIGTTAYGHIGSSTSTNGQLNITLTENWERYYITYTLKDAYPTSDNVSTKYLLFRNDNLPTYWDVCGIKLEKGNVSTAWSPSPEDAESSVTALATYVNQVRDDLQNQIDGAIQFWNGSEIPTLNNYPANQWKTEDEKIAHQADIYTVIVDQAGQLKQGKGYRFDKVNGTWTWVEITDQEMSAVQALAESKAKVFVTTPIVPYNVGDLWLKDGKLYRCKTAKKADGSYALADWEIATDYTNDDAANAVQLNLDNLKIGGTNLVSNRVSNWTSGSWSSATGQLPYISAKSGRISLKEKIAIEPNTEYWIKVYTTKTNVRALFRICDSDDNFLRSATALADTKWTSGENDAYIHLTLYENSVVSDIEDGTTKVKLEKGNRATDWSPAPEDNIKSLDVEYYLSTSSTSATGGEWKTEAPTWENGKYMWSRQKLTYADGAEEYKNETCIAGASAKMVDITTSSQMFKSTDGGTTFTPNTIILTPRFQDVKYNHWEYSTNGGSSWTTVTSGQHGLTISNSNLTISKSSDLYTSSVTAISFKCVSDTSTVYDTTTVLKVQDGVNGTSPYNVILTNESQTIAGDTSKALATTITTNVIGYQGSTQQNTTVGTISGLPTGMTAVINNNNSKTTSITFTVTTSMTTKSGQVTIPVTIGSATINKVFSYALSLKGSTGTAAKVVIINPSSQMFKSVTGPNGTFLPQYIYLYPNFQSCSYSKWQYSLDGTTWTNVTSGSNSLTIGTYNSIANSLRIERNSNLYTEAITSISFKCISDTATIYDTVTVTKLYDVTEIEIGGKNYVTKTSSEWSDWIVPGTGTNKGATLNSIDLATMGLKVGDNITMQIELETQNFTEITKIYAQGAVNGVWSGDKFFTNPWTKIFEITSLSDLNKTQRFTKIYQMPETTIEKINTVGGVCNLGVRVDGANAEAQYRYRMIKIEKGNQPTDWSPASEDLSNNQTLQYTTTTTNTAPGSSASWDVSVPVSTEYYIWQRLHTVYQNGTIENSAPVCIYTPAIQISNIEEQYFIHTSDSTPPNKDSTSWLNEKPAWKDEYYQEATRRYLWVRTKYTYTGNKAKVEYSIPYYDPTWETISILNKSIIDNAEIVENAINNGYVTIKDGYIEIRDKADSTKGILLSKEGISFKNNNNTYTSVWSLDGTFDAQSILVKNLNANNILSGTLTLQAAASASDASNGVFLLENQSGAEVAKIDVNGLKITAVDGSYIYLRTGEDDNTKKGIYLVDAGGNTFVSTDTTNGIFTVEKQIINDYQEFNGNIRIISIANRGIGFIGI